MLKTPRTIIEIVVLTFLVNAAVAQENLQPVDIDQVVSKVKEKRFDKYKGDLLNELTEVMETSNSQYQRLKAVLGLSELLLYVRGGRPRAESLLIKHEVELLENAPLMQAQYHHLRGLVYFIKSRHYIRSIQNEKKRLIAQGVGGESKKPFLYLARQHFNESLTKGTPADGVRALKQLKAVNDPLSHEAFELNYEVGRMFDEHLNQDMFMAVSSYQVAINAFENGASGERLTDESIPEWERIEQITQMSWAYFMVASFDKGIGLNEVGLNFFSNNPESRNLHYNRAFLFKYLSKFDKAEQEFESVIDNYTLSDDEWDQTNLELVRALRKQKKNDKAKTVLTRLLNKSQNPKIKDQAQKWIDTLSTN